jgi:hypothetical protein
MKNMTLAQLREVATRKNIPGRSRMSKAELLTALQATTVQPTVGPKFSGEY